MYFPGDPLMALDSGFTHRQTLAGVVRFNSPDLHTQASKVVEAGAHALAPEAAAGLLQGGVGKRTDELVSADSCDCVARPHDCLPARALRRV